MAEAAPHRADHQAEELWPGCWRHVHPHDDHTEESAHGGVRRLHLDEGHPHYHPGPGAEHDQLVIVDHHVLKPAALDADIGS